MPTANDLTTLGQVFGLAGVLLLILTLGGGFILYRWGSASGRAVKEFGDRIAVATEENAKTNVAHAERLMVLDGKLDKGHARIIEIATMAQDAAEKAAASSAEAAFYGRELFRFIDGEGESK